VGLSNTAPPAIKTLSLWTSQVRTLHTQNRLSPFIRGHFYTWGDPSQSRSVIINGCKLEVNSNAFDILQDRATFLKTRKIWIDSICINQVDKEEKSIQIPLMREIYSRESRVLVWLGSQPDSRIAMGFISNLNRRLRFGGLHGPELKTILEIGSKSPKWPALFSLLNYQYWTRSWIIQEIAVAELVHIFYGDSILPGNTLPQL
jgi:hypothetical protein